MGALQRTDPGDWTQVTQHMTGRGEEGRSAVKTQALPASEGSTVPLERSPSMPAVTFDVWDKFLWTAVLPGIRSLSKRVVKGCCN